MTVYIKRNPPSPRRRPELPVTAFRIDPGQRINPITSSQNSVSGRAIRSDPIEEKAMCNPPGKSTVTAGKNRCQRPIEQKQDVSSNYSGVPDDQLDDLQKLQKHCPQSSKAERKRFLVAKGGNYELARDQLQRYLEWRQDYGLDNEYHCSTRISLQCENSDENEHENETDVWHGCASDDQTLDELDWKFASQKAMLYDDKHSICTTTVLPQLARIIASNDDETNGNSSTIDSSSIHNHSCDRNGHRILQLLPAQMDLSVASESTFALCIALYLERKLCRESDEKMTVVIDVRGGIGWANPPPQNLVPFIKQVSACLEQNFPERLSKSVLFPMPLAATFLWKMVRVFLDPNTVEKIDLVRGNASTTAQPPYKQMEKHMDRCVLEKMEVLRCASFVEDSDS